MYRLRSLRSLRGLGGVAALQVAAAAASRPWGPRPDTLPRARPCLQVGGLSSALAVLAAGGRHVFMPRYSAAEAWRLVQQHQVTALIAVPAMVDDLAAHAAALQRQAHQQQQQQEAQRQAQRQGPAGLQAARAAAAAAPALPSVTKLLVGAGGMAARLQVRSAATGAPDSRAG
jgi:acyl-CoA synthetase (AMP-forming)/AMP-acid ligase II